MSAKFGYSCVLSNLLWLGQWETMLHLVHGLDRQAQSIEERQKLKAFGVQAAWRLGNWDQVESFQPEGLESDFEVSTGRYLSLFVFQTSFSVYCSRYLKETKKRLRISPNGPDWRS